MSCKARWLLPFAHMRKPSPHSERAWPGLQVEVKGETHQGQAPCLAFAAWTHSSPCAVEDCVCPSSSAEAVAQKCHSLEILFSSYSLKRTRTCL